MDVTGQCYILGVVCNAAENCSTCDFVMKYLSLTNPMNLSEQSFTLNVCL